MRWDFWRQKPPAPTPEQAPVKPTRREPTFRIPDELLARLGSKPAPQRQAYVIPAPPPGVVPQGAPTMAMDQTINVMARWGDESGQGEGVNWLGYAYLSELLQRPEYRRISSVRAKEMTRKWIKLNAAADESKNDTIKAITAEMKRLKAQDAFRRAAELDGGFGRGHIYIDTGATDDEAELKTPLFIHKDKIGIGTLKALRVVEPIWTYPGQYSSVDPLRSDFYRPTSWFVMSKEIHASRLFTFIGREMPDMLKPAFMFGGLSMTQMAKPYVDWWLKDRNSASDILNFFSTSVLKTDMAGMMAGGGDEMLKRIEAFERLRQNRGVLAINKETEEFANVSAPLGTVDKLVAQAQEHVASVSGMPLVKYTGITPSGLNASSEDEIRVFYDEIASEQADMFSGPLEQLLQIVQLSLFGEIDESITHEFVSLWQLDEAGAAAVQKTKADTAAVYIQEGAISPGEVREHIATDPESMFHGLDLNSPAPGAPGGGEGDIDTHDPFADRIDEPTDADGAANSPPDGDTIAEISLNGAQVTSMVDIIGKVGSGELPLESAIAILTTAFPIDDGQARKLMTGIVPGSQKQPDDAGL